MTSTLTHDRVDQRLTPCFRFGMSLIGNGLIQKALPCFVYHLTGAALKMTVFEKTITRRSGRLSELAVFRVLSL